MSLKEEFKKPYNIIASIVLVALILFWAPWSNDSDELENARGMLMFFEQLPGYESEKVCVGVDKLEEKVGDRYPELDELKARVRAKHDCEETG